MKKLPIGISSFEKIRSEAYAFDKRGIGIPALQDALEEGFYARSLLKRCERYSAQHTAVEGLRVKNGV